MSKYQEAINAFNRGAQVFVNNQEMFGYNASNKTIKTSYSIIPVANLDSITIME